MPAVFVAVSVRERQRRNAWSHVIAWVMPRCVGTPRDPGPAWLRTQGSRPSRGRRKLFCRETWVGVGVCLSRLDHWFNFRLPRGRGTFFSSPYSRKGFAKSVGNANYEYSTTDTAVGLLIR